jgi:pyruvate,water dikinase
MPAFIAWFEELSRSSGASVGGKGANLGEMKRAGLPVPDGFVVTTSAFLAALDAGGVRAELQALLRGTNADSPQALAEAADAMRALVPPRGCPGRGPRGGPRRLFAQLGDADAAVAVRSSATSGGFRRRRRSPACTRRSPTCSGRTPCSRRSWSIAGRRPTAPRVLAYRNARELRDEPVLAVVVQCMIDSERSGVMFTADPASGDRTRSSIEGAFGLGEVVVGGLVEPDTYVVAKDGPDGSNPPASAVKDVSSIVRGPDGAERRVEH